MSNANLHEELIQSQVEEEEIATPEEGDVAEPEALEPEDNPEEGEEEESDGDEGEKPKNHVDLPRGVKKKMARLARQNKEAADLIRDLHNENLALRTGAPSAPAPKPAAQPNHGTDKPQRENYADETDYTLAVMDYGNRMKGQQAATQRYNDDYSQKFNKLKKTYDDFTENLELDSPEQHEKFVKSTEQLAIVSNANPGVEQALLDSDIPMQLISHLGTNPDELRRIANLSPVKAIKEITKLELQLHESAKKKVSEKKPTLGDPKRSSTTKDVATRSTEWLAQQARTLTTRQFMKLDEEYRHGKR